MIKFSGFVISVENFGSKISFYLKAMKPYGRLFVIN